MSGMDAAIQAVLLQAQALNQIAENIPAVLPIPVGPAFAVTSMGTVTIPATSATVVTDALCTTTSLVFLQAGNASAAALNVYVDTILNGSFGIEHPGAASGETFYYLIADTS